MLFATFPSPLSKSTRLFLTVEISFVHDVINLNMCCADLTFSPAFWKELCHIIYNNSKSLVLLKMKCSNSDFFSRKRTQFSFVSIAVQILMFNTVYRSGQGCMLMHISLILVQRNIRCALTGCKHASVHREFYISAYPLALFPDEFRWSSRFFRFVFAWIMIRGVQQSLCYSIFLLRALRSRHYSALITCESRWICSHYQ